MKQIRVITLAPPITDVSLCFTDNTSRRLCSKFWHPRPTPAPSERIWWWILVNNKATGLPIYHFLHESSALQPRFKLRCVQGWKPEQKGVKAAGSGRELGSDPRHSFRPTLSRPLGLRGFWEQTEGLSLSAPPLHLGWDADAPLLFWEVDSSKEFIHKGQKLWWRRRKWNKQGGAITAETRMLTVSCVCLKKLEHKNTEQRIKWLWVLRQVALVLLNHRLTLQVSFWLQTWPRSPLKERSLEFTNAKSKLNKAKWYLDLWQNPETSK